MKSYQQTLLHILRLLGASYLGEEDTNVRFRQAWQLTCEFYQKINNQPKKASILEV